MLLNEQQLQDYLLNSDKSLEEILKFKIVDMKDSILKIEEELVQVKKDLKLFENGSSKEKQEIRSKYHTIRMKYYQFKYSL